MVKISQWKGVLQTSDKVKAKYCAYSMLATPWGWNETQKKNIHLMTSAWERLKRSYYQVLLLHFLIKFLIENLIFRAAVFQWLPHSLQQMATTDKRASIICLDSLFDIKIEAFCCKTPCQQRESKDLVFFLFSWKFLLILWHKTFMWRKMWLFCCLWTKVFKLDNYCTKSEDFH